MSKLGWGELIVDKPCEFTQNHFGVKFCRLCCAESTLPFPIVFVQVNYFVDCHYSGDDQRLWVIGGTNAGTLGYFPVNYQGMGAIGPPEAVLEGGHTGVVRSVLPMSSKQIGTAQSQGIFGWTGGEDGRLCCWFSDGSPETNRSWISSEFVMKSPRTCKKNRHLPY